MNGPWFRYANLPYALEGAQPRPERQAVALALIEHPQCKVRSYSRAAEAFGSGTEWVTPTPDLLKFVAHMYQLPAGYLTGEDDNQIRDTALDRACHSKVIDDIPIPDSFFVADPCRPTSETSSGEERSTSTRRMRKLVHRAAWVHLARPFLALLVTVGWTANTLLTTGNYLQWLGVAVFTAMTAILFGVDLRRVSRALRLLRLPQSKFQSVMEGRLREEVGTNLQDLMTRTPLPPAWFHDTLCHQRPLSAIDLALISTTEMGGDRILYAAIDRQLKHPGALA